MVKIICEGSDDKSFIRLLLNDLKNSGDILGIKNFDKYIEIMGSKRKLLDSKNSKYLKILNHQVKDKKFRKVLFIFDCDFEKDDENCNGMKKSQECFNNLKKNLNWNIEIDLYIFDKNLDYFLLETINTKECYEHFDKLIECLDVEKLKPNKKPIANLYRDLYPYPQFAFKDERFTPLKTKLKNLFKENVDG